MPKSSAANRKVPPAQFYLYPEGIWCWKSWKWLCILFGCHCYAKLLGEGISLPKCSVCFRSIPNPEPLREETSSRKAWMCQQWIYTWIYTWIYNSSCI